MDMPFDPKINILYHISFGTVGIIYNTKAYPNDNFIHGKVCTTQNMRKIFYWLMVHGKL